MKLSNEAAKRLEIVRDMREKSHIASNTLNIAKAKRLGGEVLNCAVDLVEQMVIEIDKLKQGGALCCK